VGRGDMKNAGHGLPGSYATFGWTTAGTFDV
jgi:hypothetical protein